MVRTSPRKATSVHALCAFLTVAAVPLTVDPARAQQGLDFGYYRANVEPIFLIPRGGGHGPGSSPCVTCHAHVGTPLRLQHLEEGENGQVFWTEEQSRRNFEVVSRLVVPGSPESSRLLRKPLAEAAGGVPFHVGGKFWEDQSNAEWQTIARWVRAASPTGPRAATTPPALDFEFFRSCVQQVFLSKRQGRMECVHCHGGPERNFARTLPEGRTFWNLEESRQNFEVLRRYLDPGYPLNSRFLTHPLSPDAGGDPYHAGGRRWMSQDDPEWQILAAWVRGEAASCRVG
jgi:hypothetical protein